MTLNNFIWILACFLLWPGWISNSVPRQSQLKSLLELQNGMDSSLKDSLNFETNLNSFQANSPRNILSREQNNPSALCTVFLKFKFEVNLPSFRKVSKVNLIIIMFTLNTFSYRAHVLGNIRKFVQKSVNS